MNSRVAKQLKEYAILACIFSDLEGQSWAFYKKLKQAYKRKEVALVCSGVVIWQSTRKPVGPELMTAEHQTQS